MAILVTTLCERADDHSSCRPSPSSCRMSPCCPLPSSCRPAALSCRLTPCCPLPLAVVVPPVAVVAIVVPPVALLPLAVARRRAAPCYRRAARRRRRASCRPASPCRQPWLFVMFSSPPRSISMAPVVGGVTHDPIKACRRMELARAASAIAVARRRRIHRRRRSSLSSLC